MSLERFGEIVARILETLPGEIAQYLDNVTVDVEEEPDGALLREQGFTQEDIESGDSLYGIFMPMALGSPWVGDAVNVRDLPRRIIIFKRPLEESFPDRRDLLIEIRKTVIHELAHHFGYSDRDLERFDNNPDPFGSDPGLFRDADA